MTEHLFQSGEIGSLSLSNRLVMAPMTRSRAELDWSPSRFAAAYYQQRNSAGLIISEATQVSANATGYSRTPGIWTDEHTARWKEIVDAVHEGEAKFFLQVWHCGRIAHPDNMPPGCYPVGPSAVQPTSPIWTDQAAAKVPVPVPHAMDENDIRQALDEHRKAAANAKAAGFDGIELHAANGYLIEQFASTNTNLRTDAWGGTMEKRMRFMVEAIEAVGESFSRDRIGIRLSPFGTFNDVDDDDPVASFAAKLDCAEKAGIGFVHVIRPHVSGNVDRLVPDEYMNVLEVARERYSGVIIAAGGYDRQTAEVELAGGNADFIAFGRPFIPNPDLPRRLREGLPLATYDPNARYVRGPEGYIDYAPLAT